MTYSCHPVHEEPASMAVLMQAIGERRLYAISNEHSGSIVAFADDESYGTIIDMMEYAANARYEDVFQQDRLQRSLNDLAERYRQMAAKADPGFGFVEQSALMSLIACVQDLAKRLLLVDRTG